MGEIFFNKLVRDKIPEIIGQSGKTLSIRLLEDNEYYSELNSKLKEEVEQYLSENTTEKLADIVEVINSILDYKNIEKEEFDKIRENIIMEKGGYKLKIFLETVNQW